LAKGFARTSPLPQGHSCSATTRFKPGLGLGFVGGRRALKGSLVVLRDGAFCRAARRACREVGGLDLLFLFLLAHLHAEELGHDVGGDAGHHVDEDVVALLLVLLLRVLLAVAAQADAVAQVLHVGEVIDPGLVELLEVDVAEDAEHELVPTSFSRSLKIFSPRRRGAWARSSASRGR
jgi:hypothetical protein